MRLLYASALALLAAPLTRAQVTFTDVTAGDLSQPIISWGVSWVDVDADGDLDLFASRTGATAGNVLFRNDGGAFTLASAGVLTDAGNPGSIGHTWADYDNDGDLDVATAGGLGRLYRNDGGTFVIVEDGPLGPAAGVRGWAAAWGDYDADGWLDLVVVHPANFVGNPPQTNHLFRGTGGGAFARVEGTPITDGLAPYTVGSWADYDLDGDADLFIGSGPATGALGPDYLYANEGAGTFSRIAGTPIADDPRDGQVMNWVDIDNDRDLDLYVTNYLNTPNDLYRNDGGAYVKVTEGPLVTDVPGAGLANTWGDVDNDGDLDAFVTGGSTDRLYLNAGDGTFTHGWTVANGATSGATLGDYDGDGDLDLAVTAPPLAGGPVRLYRNDTANDHRALVLDLVGVASNRSAIGAKVWVRAALGGQAVWQHREVSAQNTFNGQNALPVHVGLAGAAAADSVRIEWPSGAVDVYTGVAAARYVATEGQSLTPVAGEPGGEAPAAPALEAAEPNPARGATTLRFALPSAGPARLAVYDVLGREVAVAAEAVLAAGRHAVRWDGTGADGRALPAGTYLLRLTTPAGVSTRPLTLAR
jgi:hypothetical protein